ncbi:MAG: DUF421 domain-containing protein, partial [Myxococcales bacterium]
MLSLLLAAATPNRPLDLHRMFLGDEEPLFMVEVALRTTIIFAFTLVALRFLGKRGVAQLSLVEVTIILGLGSAVGDPMFQPDVPLLHALIVISVIVVLYRMFTATLRKNEAFERFMEGETRCLLSNGVLQLDMMEKDRLSQEKLFELLRLAGVTQLGEVKCAYLEQSGELSVFSAPPAEVRAGLAIVPPWDVTEPETFEAGVALDAPDTLACRQCGACHEHRAGAPLPLCPRCHHP